MALGLLRRPHVFAAAMFLALSYTSAFATADEPTTASPIAAALQPFIERQTLAGAVTLVADAENVLSVDTVGFSDVAAKRPMPADALFWIASQSKSITAAALMMLVDEGRVKLDDPVEKYLPEFKDLWLSSERDERHVLLKRPAHAITVRDILSHTSGMPFRSAMEQPTLDMLSLRVAALSYAMTPLQFEPDRGYQYSNAGINTAGRIIEVVSGLPYEDFLDRHLFQPLGMTDTTFWPNEEQLSRLAKSYKPGPNNTGLEETTIGQLTYPLADRRRQPMPAGGLFSTARDVGRFCQMVLNGGEWEGRRYLSDQAIGEMTRRQTSEELKESYGLGWATGGDWFGHGGAFSTNMTVDTGHELVTVFMVQHAGFPGDGNQSLAAFKKAAVEQFGGR